MEAEKIEEIIQGVKKVLDGIDTCTQIDNNAWWQNHSGAKFGAEKLAEIENYLRDKLK